MTFPEICKKLNIEDYAERIWHSHSHGELFHIYDYAYMAERLKNDPEWFRPVFLEIVKFCEETWERPESCFQHMPALIRGYMETARELVK